MLSFCHRTRSRVVLAVAVALGVTAAAAPAQQHTGSHGLVFSAEAGPLGQRSLFTVQSAKAVSRVNLRILEGARVPSVRRGAGLRVGTLTIDALSAPLALTIPRGATSSKITLAHHGALRVVFTPKAKTVLTISGLPARTHSVQLDLRGGKGQLLTSQGCKDEQNFRATVLHAGAKKAVQATAGVTC